jgi:hypothetical protein
MCEKKLKSWPYSDNKQSAGNRIWINYLLWLKWIHGLGAPLWSSILSQQVLEEKKFMAVASSHGKVLHVSPQDSNCKNGWGRLKLQLICFCSSMVASEKLQKSTIPDSLPLLQSAFKCYDVLHQIWSRASFQELMHLLCLLISLLPPTHQWRVSWHLASAINTWSNFMQGQILKNNHQGYFTIQQPFHCFIEVWVAIRTSRCLRHILLWTGNFIF